MNPTKKVLDDIKSLLSMYTFKDVQDMLTFLNKKAKKIGIYMLELTQEAIDKFYYDCCDKIIELAIDEIVEKKINKFRRNSDRYYSGLIISNRDINNVPQKKKYVIYYIRKILEILPHAFDIIYPLFNISEEYCDGDHYINSSFDHQNMNAFKPKLSRKSKFNIHIQPKINPIN